MIREALTGALRRLLSPWGGGTRPLGGLVYERWKDPEPSSSSQYQEYLTVQHYVHQEGDLFTASLMRARAMLAEASPGTGRSQLLLDTMEANQARWDGDITAAVRLYSALVTRETDRYVAKLRHSEALATAELLQHRLALGLLHHNYALALEQAKSGPAQIEEQFRRAIEYIPGVSMIRASLARFYRDQSRWDDAAVALREEHAVASLWDHESSRKVLNSQLAQVALDKAEALVPGIDSQQPGSRKRVEADTAVLERALDVIDTALDTIQWDDIPSWRGKLCYRRAQFLELLGRVTEAIPAYQQSAGLYEEAKDHSSATYVRTVSVDAMARSRGLPELADAYERVLAAVGSVPAEDWTEELRERRKQSVQARLAAVALARGMREAGSAMLAQSLRPQSDNWGPYYDVVSEITALLKRSDIRHAVSVLYHELLRERVAAEPQRDLTAALLELYEHEREALESAPGERDVVRDTSRAAELLNVVTPLVIEVSETITDRMSLNDSVVTRFSESLMSALKERYGVHIPGVRLRESSQVGADEYCLMIHEVPLARGRLDADSLEPAFRHLEELIASNLIELVGHQEVQNYLERNLLVQPVVSDIAEKENCRHVDPLSAVLRALVVERVPLQGQWQFADVDIRNAVSLAGRIGKKSDAVSAFLAESFKPADLQFVSDPASGAGPERLRNLLAEHLNRAVGLDDLYTAERFRSVELRQETKDRLAQSADIRDSKVLNRLLLEDAFPGELETGPADYPKLVYEAFRRGQTQGSRLADIVEGIRSIACVRARLWGNDAAYAPLLLPAALTGLIDSCIRDTVTGRVIVMDPRQATVVLDALQDGIRAHARPSLVTKRQDQRALVRALISTRLPEVPVLSIHELQPSVLRALTPLEWPTVSTTHGDQRTASN